MAGNPMNLCEAAELLGIAPSTVRKRIFAGQLQAEKDGSRWIIYPDVLEKYRERRRYRPTNSSNHGVGGNGQRVGGLTAEEKAILERNGIRLN